MANGIGSMGTYLMHGTGTGTLTWEKLIDIKNVPALLDEIETLETTTLSNYAHTYIPGLINNGEDITVTANYTKENFEAIQALEGSEINLSFWFGDDGASPRVPDGHNGKFTFKGYVQAGKPETEVNAVVEMSIHIIPSSEIVFS